MSLLVHPLSTRQSIQIYAYILMTTPYDVIVILQKTHFPWPYELEIWNGTLFAANKSAMHQNFKIDNALTTPYGVIVILKKMHFP